MSIKKKFTPIVLFFLSLLTPTFSHSQQVKGIYVDLFGNYILGNPNLENNLISYAQANNFNYLILYNLGGSVLSRNDPETATNLSTIQTSLSDFISTAKHTITGLQIGASDGALKDAPSQVQSVFFDNVIWFNGIVSDPYRSIDVLHLEYEYWKIGTWLDNKYAFEHFYLEQLDHMRTLANSSNPQVLVETYLGKINTIIDPADPTNSLNLTEQAQANAIDPLAHRVLLHCYMPSYFMQNRLYTPGYVNLQFEYDYGSGKRFEAFSNNLFNAKILPLFSSESSDIHLTLASFYGDYLWFNGLHNSGHQTSASGTTNQLGYPLDYVNDINQPFIDFNFCYNNNLDPYGPNPNWGNACIPFNSSDCHFNFIQNPNSLSIDFIAEPSVLGSNITWDFGDLNTGTGLTVSHSYSSNGNFLVCMNEIDQISGLSICQFCSYINAGNSGGSTMSGCTSNTIDGQVWFKYSSMPLKDNYKPIYLDLGPDLTRQPTSSVTLHPSDNLSAINTALDITSNPITIVRYEWYKNGDWVWETLPTSPDYTVISNPSSGSTDIYTCEIVTNFVNPYAFNYRYRDDIKITSDQFYPTNYSYYTHSCPKRFS